MAERILSVEIGYSLTKVCEIENSGKGPKIHNSFVIATPEGMVRDGAVELDNEFINQFQRMMSVKHIKTKKAIFTVSSNKIATREAVIPYVKDKQVQAVVRANLSEYFPVDLSQYLFSHTVLEVMREEDKSSGQIAQIDKAAAKKVEDDVYSSTSIEEASEDKGSKKKAKNVQVSKALGKPTGLKLLVLAAPKQLVTSYERMAKAINLELVTIDYNGNSIYQAAKEECKDGVQLIIKVDERSAMLIVLENGVIALNRTINYGIDEAIMTLQQCKELGDTGSYDKALEVARRKTVILSSFNDGRMDIVDLDNEAKDEQIKAEKKMVTESLRPLVGGIIRVIDYYNSNHTSNPIEKMYVTGIGADFSGLSNLLTNEAGLKIKNLTHLAGIDIERVFKDVTYGEYVACIGASIAPLMFYPDHIDEKGNGKGKGGSKSNVNTFIIAIIVFIGGIGVAGYLAASSILPYMKAKEQKAEYEKTIQELQPSYDIYMNYVKEDEELRFLKSLEKNTRNRNEEILSVISNLEQNMPHTFMVNSLEADKEKITIEATVSSKEEVAYVVDRLKMNELFADVEITGATLEENDLGEFHYEFSVDMFYAPYEDEITTEEEVE
ncbi:MAG: PilN domain-containing protein [Lachnospiraceae bacterium]|nr:PilN domain-containing protein [Candidatus Colinaster scatohippi]